jgi:DNA-directed RNA polymerase subunit RPC12/RpoP
MPDDIAAAYRRTQENMPGIMGAEEIDTDYTRQLVCPYCGRKMKPEWLHDRKEWESECGNCRKKFATRVTAYFSKNKED